MKTNNLLILLAVLFALYSCETEEMISDNQLSSELLVEKAPPGAIVVAPSNDLSGVTDAANIENALELAKANGGTVYLSDGYPNTKDHYYTSRNIIVEGFNGTLMGEGKNKTFIHAGRKSAAEGFSTSYSPIWTVIFPHNPTAATVFQFDSPTGDVTIKKFSILVEDDAPVEPHLDYYGDNGTHIWTALELTGGFFNSTIEDIRIEGKESSAIGNEYGFNLGWGIHVMPFGGGGAVSWPPPKHQGTLTLKNIDVENLAYDALLFMDYRDGSEILVDQVSAKNVGYGVSASRILDSNVDVRNVEVVSHYQGFATGMYFWFMNTPLEVSDCSITNAKFYSAIVLANLRNASVTNTNFVDCNSLLGAIGLYGAAECTLSQNDFRDSGLPGWTDSTNGPGAVFMNGFSADNYVHEMKFPAGLTVCDMISDYGSNNTIHNWESCQEYSNKELATKKNSDSDATIAPDHRSQYSLR